MYVLLDVMCVFMAFVLLMLPWRFCGLYRAVVLGDDDRASSKADRSTVFRASFNFCALCCCLVWYVDLHLFDQGFACGCGVPFWSRVVFIPIGGFGDYQLRFHAVAVSPVDLDTS